MMSNGQMDNGGKAFNAHHSLLITNLLTKYILEGRTPVEMEDHNGPVI